MCRTLVPRALASKSGYSGWWMPSRPCPITGKSMCACGRLSTDPGDELSHYANSARSQSRIPASLRATTSVRARLTPALTPTKVARPHVPAQPHSRRAARFGDKTHRPRAASRARAHWPVALSTDRAGVFDLNLPLTGSLDDQNSSWCSIIWKGVRHIRRRRSRRSSRCWGIVGRAARTCSL